MLPRHHPHARANRSAIALGAHQLDLDPILFVATLITKQRRQIVHIQNQHIHVTVVVVIAKSSAAAGELFADARPHLRRNVFETAVTQIPVNQPRILVSLVEVVIVDLRIDVAIDLDNVLPAVIVVIHKSATPRYITVVDTHAGSKRNIAESPIAVVVVQVAGVIGKVGLEYIEPSVTVVVGHAHAHPGLLMSVVTVSATRHDCDIGERAIMVVLEQDARCRVHGNINIRPPIIVEVVRNSGNRIPRARLENSRLLRNVGKCAVTVVAIEKIRITIKPPWTTHDRHALPLAKLCVVCRRNRLRIQLEIIANKKIEVAVPIVVEKSTAGAPANLRLVKTGFVRYIGECAIPIVTEENVVSPETAK